MPQFTSSPALQARTFDIQDIQRQSLQNQLRQSELQQAQNPQADPRLDLAREKFEFSQDKDERAQGLQHVKVLGQYAGAAARASGVQRIMIHGEAVKYAQANGIATDDWRDPGDPEYVAWAQAQQARAGQAEKQAVTAPSGYQKTEGGLEAIPGGPADPPQAGRLAAAKRDPSGEDGFGKGMEGQAYNALLEYKAYIDAGQTPPSGVIDRARVAQHTLNKRRFFRDPEGNLLSYTPGVPEGFPTPDRQSKKTPESEQEDGSPSAGGLRTEIEAKPKVDVSLPVSTIRKISELLNAGGETITGVVGTAKRLGGGLARQAGIPVSERAERLQRLLETLQGQMGPIILNEKRLSETERARLERIVGNVSPTMDEQALRSALADLVDFIVSVEAR